MPRIWQHYWYPIVLAALLPAVASNIIGILTTVAVALIAVAIVIVLAEAVTIGTVIPRWCLADHSV